MKQPTVTLVLVDTDSYTLAAEALKFSLKFKFEDVLVFSDQDGWFQGGGIKIKKINSLSEYNQLLIHDVPKYIKSSHFLVIQFDGFILNPSLWAELFYFYDYIGAPWPRNAMGAHCVGNGGFSLRSTKLALRVAELAEKFNYTGAVPEDLYICKDLRPTLEQEGFHFADESIASHFSAEYRLYRYPTFGFHHIKYLPLIYRERLDFLVDNLSSRLVLSHGHLLLPRIRDLSERQAARLEQKFAMLKGR